MTTLHGYILRELLKTFGLTLATLTTLFTLGGGLFNVVSYEGISASDVASFIPMLIPMAVTITMPIAAVFAAAIVYGRLAADNEFTACRAAGINIHRLFLSGLLLSIFVALFTFIFGNFVAPNAATRIESFIRGNIRDLVSQTLQNKGFIHRGKEGQDNYTLTAERVQGVSDAALTEKGFATAPGLDYLLIHNPTLLRTGDAGELIRFAVAQYGLCIFDARPAQIEVTLIIRNARDFQVGKRAATIHQQTIGPYRLPMMPLFRLSIADLRDLLRWRQAPWEVPKLQTELEAFRANLARQLLFTFCAARLDAGQGVTLHDQYERTFEITADSTERKDYSLNLGATRVEVRDSPGARPTIYTADRAELNMGAFGQSLLIEIKLLQTADQDVLEYNPRFGNPDEPRQKETVNLDGALVPEQVITQLDQITPAAILDPAATIEVPARFEEQRIGLQKSAGRWQRKIAATIHARLGYISSVLVTVLMGAALGVIFRGARMLAAVGFSLIPFFSVGILMMLGNHLTKDASTTMIGPLVIWGGLATLLWGNLLLMWLGVRR